MQEKVKRNVERKKQGGKDMSKVKMMALIGLMVVTSGVRKLWANSNAANNADSLTIRVTPNVDRGVNIDTAAVVLNLGTLPLYQSTQTVRPSTVTIDGTLNGQELDISGSISGGWSFDLSPSTWGNSGENNRLATYVLFSDNALATAPDGDAFAGANADFTGETLRVGGSSGAGTKFEKTSGGNTVDMDNKNPSDQAHMWIFLRLPNTTSTANPQDVTLTLTAKDAS